MGADTNPSLQEMQVSPQFNVEVGNAPEWYNNFLQVQQGETPRRGFSVGNITLGDQVLGKLKVMVKLTGEETDASPTFYLGARMDYSDLRLEKDKGFNPPNEAATMATLLKREGIKVRFSTNKSKQQLVLLEDGGVQSAG